MPIPIPEKVAVEIDGGKVIVTGPKGKLEQVIRPEIKVEKKEKEIKVTAKDKTKIGRSLHGLSRTLIANMIKGVVDGYEKVLELHGVGYRAKLDGKNLYLTVGFSHPVIIEPKPEIEFEVEGKNIIKVRGIDKQLVGQTTAEIRAVRKPDAYKGKGIRYQGEKIKLKPGKAAKIGAEGAAK
jgi:large subunit ribosomal protein L6